MLLLPVPLGQIKLTSDFFNFPSNCGIAFSSWVLDLCSKFTVPKLYYYVGKLSLQLFYYCKREIT